MNKNHILPAIRASREISPVAPEAESLSQLSTWAMDAMESFPCLADSETDWRFGGRERPDAKESTAQILTYWESVLRRLSAELKSPSGCQCAPEAQRTEEHILHDRAQWPILFITLRDTLAPRLLTGFGEFSKHGFEAHKAFDALPAAEYHRMARAFNAAAMLYYYNACMECSEEPERYEIYLEPYQVYMERYAARMAYHWRAIHEPDELKQLSKACLKLDKEMAQRGSQLLAAAELKTSDHSPLSVPGIYEKRRGLYWELAHDYTLTGDYKSILPPLIPKGVAKS